jgi:hypothetical protein
MHKQQNSNMPENFLLTDFAKMREGIQFGATGAQCFTLTGLLPL